MSLSLYSRDLSNLDRGLDENITVKPTYTTFYPSKFEVV